MAFEGIRKARFLLAVFAIIDCKKKSYRGYAEEALRLWGDYSERIEFPLCPLAEEALRLWGDYSARPNTNQNLAAEEALRLWGDYSDVVLE